MNQKRRRLALAIAVSGASLVWSTAHAADAVETAEPAPAVEADLSGLTQTIGLHAGDWLVRARIAGLFPVRETSTVGLIGGKIDTPDMVLPDLQIAYFLTDHISVEGQAGVIRTRPKIVGSLVGDLDIGTIWSAAAAASVQYHFRPDARFNPYVGAGVSHSTPISIEPAKGIADFDLTSQTSIMVQAGVDYQISGNWFGNGVAKYLFVPEQVYEGGGAKFTVDSDMVFVGAGIGYRF